MAPARPGAAAPPSTSAGPESPAIPAFSASPSTSAGPEWPARPDSPASPGRFTRSRTSAVSPAASAAAPSCRSSWGLSTWIRKTRARTAAAISAGVLPGPPNASRAPVDRRRPRARSARRRRRPRRPSAAPVPAQDHRVGVGLDRVEQLDPGGQRRLDRGRVGGEPVQVVDVCRARAGACAEGRCRGLCRGQRRARRRAANASSRTAAGRSSPPGRPPGGPTPPPAASRPAPPRLADAPGLRASPRWPAARELPA